MKTSRPLKLGCPLWQRALAIFAVVTLLQMPYYWTFWQPASEIDLLAIARQAANPDWLPQDWYLNHGGRSDFWFRGVAWLVGVAVERLGWVTTVVLGRLLCYGLLSIGLAIVTQQLELRVGTSILAIGLWLGFSRLVPIDSAPNVYFGFAGVAFVVLILTWTGRFPNLKRHYFKLFLVAFGLLLSANDPQTLATGALMVPNFTLASIAYGLVTIGLGLFLNDRRYPAAAIAGLAASFHPTVGGFGFLTMFLCWLLEDVFLGTLRTQPHLKTIAPFAIGAIALWPLAWDELTAVSPLSDVLASEIRVFFRFTRLLDPATWNPTWWLKLGTYLLVLVLSIYMVASIRQRAATPIDSGFPTRRALAFLLVSFLPFAVGLVTHSFDRTGAWLQYAPFRFFDVMLPLLTLLFFARAAQTIGAPGLAETGFDRLCVLLVLPIVVRAGLDFVPFFADPAHGLQAGTTESERDLYAWVRAETSPEATLVAPPDLAGMQVLGDRGTVAAFQWFPRRAPEIVEWFARLDDLSAGAAHETIETTRTGRRRLPSHIASELAQAYTSLDRDRVFDLLDRYGADCFVTTVDAGFVSAVDRAPDYENIRYAAYCLAGPERADRSTPQ